MRQFHTIIIAILWGQAVSCVGSIPNSSSAEPSSKSNTGEITRATYDVSNSTPEVTSFLRQSSLFTSRPHENALRPAVTTSPKENVLSYQSQYKTGKNNTQGHTVLDLDHRLDDPINIISPSFSSKTSIDGKRQKQFVVSSKQLHVKSRGRRDAVPATPSTTPNPHFEQIKIATVLPADETRLFAIKRVQPAIEYAIEKMNPVLAPYNKTLVVKFRDSNCDIADGINEAINFYVQKEMDVLFGPCCDYAVAPCARQVYTNYH